MTTGGGRREAQESLGRLLLDLTATGAGQPSLTAAPGWEQPWSGEGLLSVVRREAVREVEQCRGLADRVVCMLALSLSRL